MPSSNNKKSRKKSNLERGKSYEKLAALFFEQNGYEILERNWRSGRKEIDLIIKKETSIIFVEVKSSSTQKFGHPSERVDNRKINNLVIAAQQYLIIHEIKDIDLRFDVVTFTDGKLEHYPDAFTAPEDLI